MQTTSEITHSGTTQNEAVEFANVTEVASSEYAGKANSLGRFRAQDVIDPYQISRARRKHPNWSIPEEPDGDCGCM